MKVLSPSIMSSTALWNPQKRRDYGTPVQWRWLFCLFMTFQWDNNIAKTFSFVFVLLVGSSPEFVRKKCLSAFAFAFPLCKSMNWCIACHLMKKNLFERIYFLSWQFFLSKNIWFCRKRKCWKSYFILLRNTEKLRLKYLKLVFNFYYNFDLIDVGKAFFRHVA